MALLKFLGRGINEIFFRLIWIFVGGVFFRIYFRLSSENCPQIKGPYILAANHSSLLDGLVLQAVIWRRISFLLTILFYRMPLLSWFFRMMYMIPIYEGGGNKNALFKAAERLREGRIVGIFPEGGVSVDGKVGKGMPGVAILSETTQLPVIPVAICGSFAAMPRGSHFPRPKKIHIRFGAPISPLERSEGPRRENYRQYTEKVMSEISALQRTNS